MPKFTYQLAGELAHIEVPDDLAGFYRAQAGYVEVATPERVEQIEAAADALTGDALADAVKAAKITHPSSLTADQKREAVAQTELDKLGAPADDNQEK